MSSSTKDSRNQLGVGSAGVAGFSGELSSRTVGRSVSTLVADKLSDLHRGVLPGLVVPPVFAGHPVNADPACHLLKALTFLIEVGVRELAGDEVGDREAVGGRAVGGGATGGREGRSAASGRDAGDGLDLVARAHRIVDTVDVSIEAFSAFGFGESVLRLGGLDAVADPERTLTAVRSPDIIRRVREADMSLAHNYAIVAARGLQAEAALTGERPAELDEFVERTATLIGQQSNGWINDMWSPLTHYDIYTPDMYLFAEPLAAELGDVWLDGLGRVMADLDDLASPAGALTWGRSAGLLALAMTVELTAVGAAHGLLSSPSPWVRRALLAARRLGGLLPDGLNAAHQHRMTMSYRGPQRRLQMGFDLLDKLAGAGAQLLVAPDLAAAPRGETWPDVQRHLAFAAPGADEPRGVSSSTAGPGVWLSRSRSLTLHVPLMRGVWSDYLPSLHASDVFETPTEGHPSFVPSIHGEAGVLLPAGEPETVEVGLGRAEISWRGWARQGAGPDDDFTVGGARRTRVGVDGRRVSLVEEIVVDGASVEQITIAVPETSARRLDVTASEPAFVRSIDTAGLAEWRSYFHELTTVHQIEVPLTAGRVDFEWSARPQLRIADTHFGAQYGATLYEGVGGERVQRRDAPIIGAEVDDEFVEALAEFDLLHLGWPEWWSGIDPERTRQVVEAVRASGVKVVWTRHNLSPHHVTAPAERADAAASYETWAGICDGLIHHSAWGRDADLRQHQYPSDARHSVIPHGHWGPQHAPHEHAERSQVEAENGWSAGRIRLAVIGSPRRHKRIADVIEAVVATDRADIELVVRIEPGDVVPDDPRILVGHEHLSETVYQRRLRAIDALVLPFAPEGMLTTGTVFDAMAAGVAVISSRWGFIEETLGDAAIYYGSGSGGSGSGGSGSGGSGGGGSGSGGSASESLAACLEQITRADLAAGAEAVGALRSSHDWGDIGDQTLALFNELVP